MPIHTAFDLFASVASFALTLIVYRWRLQSAMQRVEQAGVGYVAALLIGAAVGGYGFGSLNLYLSGNSQVARSIIGAVGVIDLLLAVGLLVAFGKDARDLAPFLFLLCAAFGLKGALTLYYASKR